VAPRAKVLRQRGIERDPGKQPRIGNSDQFNFTGDTAMKHSILFAALTVAVLSAPSGFAQDAKPAPAKPATGMGMGVDKQMPLMQESMKAMQQQMATLQKTADPKERQKLLQEHMQAMQDNMKTMRGMGGPMMMGGGQAGGMGMGKGTAGGDMVKRYDLMENRMDMMQMMMEQMMQHDQMMQSIPAK
jgi:hypothetical protein